MEIPTIVNLLLTTLLVCYIIDLSGFINSIKKFIINKILNIKANPEDISLKPFDCSLCMSWWCGLIYLLIVKDFTLFNIFILSLFSYFSSNLAGILSWIKELFTTIENKLYNLLKF